MRGSFTAVLTLLILEIGLGALSKGGLTTEIPQGLNPSYTGNWSRGFRLPAINDRYGR